MPTVMARFAGRHDSVAGNRIRNASLGEIRALGGTSVLFRMIEFLCCAVDRCRSVGSDLGLRDQGAAVRIAACESGPSTSPTRRRS